MATITGRITDYGNVNDFRSVLEDRLNAKKSELGETEQSLKKFVGSSSRQSLPTKGTSDAPDRLPSFRGRLGPAVSVRGGGRGGNAVQNVGDKRLRLGARLGPRVSESLDDDDDDSKANGFGGEVTGRGSVMSRIVVEQKSREDALAEQKVDKKETQVSTFQIRYVVGEIFRYFPLLIY